MGQGQILSIKNMPKPLPYYPPGAYLPIVGSGSGNGSEVGLSPTMTVKRIVNPNDRNCSGAGLGPGLGLGSGQGFEDSFARHSADATRPRQSTTTTTSGRSTIRGFTTRGTVTTPIGSTRAASVGLMMSRQSLLSRSTDLNLMAKSHLLSGSLATAGSMVSSSSQVDGHVVGIGTGSGVVDRRERAVTDIMEFDDDRCVRAW